MASFKISVFQGVTSTVLSSDSEKSFLSILREGAFTGVAAACGGNGTCKQCTVTITGKVRHIASGAIIIADHTELLSCAHAPAGDCEVILREAEKMEILTRGAGDISPCGLKLGIAVDIGTTTVAVYLYDLETGRHLWVESERNAQRPFGADVISRIQFSKADGGLNKLTDAIRSQLSGMIDVCCHNTGRKRNDITRITIAGNTVMEHIFMNLSPLTIGTAPFKVLSLFGESVSADKIFEGLSEGAAVYLCPALAGYVGGDITAGILSSGAWESEEPCLFLDIGTNGEMGVGDKNGFVCCATAAGPAFEGAEIECGMDSSAGAISKVRYKDGKLDFSVIGDVEPIGICGSGIIDAICAMLRCGAVSESGRLLFPDEAPENIRSRLRRDEKGRMRFYFTDSIYVSGDDIRQLQMAKAAIRAGIETLLCLRNMKYSDIRKVIIAGGFGAYMDVRSACGIGLFPPTFFHKTHHAGNTAGGGAALALNEMERALLSKITSKCEYLELSSSAVFMEKYVEFMAFDKVEAVFCGYPEAN